jgi:hypothetical protein
VSTFRIGSEAELESFLRILSEESRQEDVIRGKQETTKRAIERDLKRYSKISEQEEGGDEEAEDDEAGAADEEAPEDDEGVEEEEGAEEEAPEGEEGAEGEEEFVSPDVTYYKVRDKINDIRAAPSLKDKEVKQDMEQWLDRLSDRERELLFSYLDTAEKIMTSKVSGSDAQDPSEPPMSIDLGGDDSGGQPEGEGSQESEESEDQATGEEDTSPPIKAGEEEQDISEVKKRLLSLMTV